jgi:hypothetical protein
VANSICLLDETPIKTLRKPLSDVSSFWHHPLTSYSISEDEKKFGKPKASSFRISKTRQIFWNFSDAPKHANAGARLRSSN